jgi:hypothetical protein
MRDNIRRAREAITIARARSDVGDDHLVIAARITRHCQPLLPRMHQHQLHALMVRRPHPEMTAVVAERRGSDAKR